MSGAADSALRAVDTSPVITAQRLVRRFNDFVAIDRLDLRINRGEVFGLLGANGAGKTTAIRMLCGTLPPTEGAIEVAGVNVVRYPRRARSRLGYVAQRFALYDELSVEENLRLQAGLYGLTGAHRAARLDWVLDHTSLRTARHTLARDLPLGHKRRLALGAALLHEPQVLFLDEPTSGVDPRARQHFWELLYEQAERGIGVLVTTHYMDEAMFCDRLALLHAGRVVADGTPEQLLARPMATPIIELRVRESAALAADIAAWPDVLETVPNAGRLRLRLRAEADVTDVRRRLLGLAAAKALGEAHVAAAAPSLEDVFVAVLEAAGEGRG